MKRGIRVGAIGVSAAAVAGVLVIGTSQASPLPQADGTAGATPPNILVIVIDDLGIDQMGFPPFSWNAAPETPSMPVLAQLAAGGVSFRNFWATPECSPSRAAMLTGRHGFRTGVTTAIVDPMLPIMQLHPSEVTVPELLAGAGYQSAMLGKYHMGGGPENTPPGYGYEAPITTVGMDFYDGYWDLPKAADTTLGGQAPEGTFDCGSIGGIGVTGAACFPDGSCIEGVHPLEAMAMGATPLLNASGTLAATCADGDCAAIDFTAMNAYYVWPRVIATPAAAGQLDDPRREYLTSFISRRTVEWVDEASQAGKPWVAFCTHSSAHTPIQPPPPSLTGPAASNASCALTGVEYRLQYKLMCESVDRSIGNMLVDLGLGTWGMDGFELGDLTAANTMIVLFNDNGTLGYDVLPPFDPTRAKQTVYETGVRSPCIVAGPMVAQPGRAVDEAVCVVDLFGLLCDAAGVDWTTVASPTRKIDCVPMMPYLTDPSQGAIREFNFAMYEQGRFAPGQVGPCLLGQTEVDGLFTSQSLCEANGGCWMGGTDAAPFPVQDYCDLVTTDTAASTVECGGITYCYLPPSMAGECPDGSTPVSPPTLRQHAVRHGQWKLVVQVFPACLAPNDCTARLYKLLEPVPPLVPGIEGDDGDPLVWDPIADTLPPEAAVEFQLLRSELITLLASQPTSTADGNLDGIIDVEDLQGLLTEWGGMTFWDANLDGIGDAQDLAMMLAQWGPLPPPIDTLPDCLIDDARTLVRDYSLDKSYADTTGSGVDAIPLGGSLARGSYVFGGNQGLQVPVDGLDLTDFAIEFELTVSSALFPFGKLVDLFDLQEDRGLYRDALGGAFQILPPFSAVSEARIIPGIPTHIRYARDAETATVALWINGDLQWVQADPLGLAIPPSDGVITLFADDIVTNEQEAFTGSVSVVRLWAGG